MQKPFLEELKFNIPKEDSGKRVDIFLVEHLSGKFSRTFLKSVIIKNLVELNNKPVKPHHKVKENDVIVIKIPQKGQLMLEPQDIALDIIYEDDDLLVVNKPSGLVTHPGAGNMSGTLVNALLGLGKELSSINELRPGIVHRLDKDTSGVMVVAKNNTTHLELAKQFANHSIKRKYIALASGVVAQDEGLINLPIARDSYNRKNMAVRFFKSRPAQTRYKVLKRFKDFTFLELTPQTGRTHQLRVHLKFIGHPILGDKKYGRNTKIAISRLALHAKSLGFFHPAKREFMEFDSHLPEELTEVMKLYKNT
ncbi:MAG: RluA family pseudouridine synthase [Candidatus Omnitrophota bacterium]